MLLLPLMTAPALAALMWKLMTNPRVRDPVLLRDAPWHRELQLGLRSADSHADRRDRRRLGLHALHHDPATCRPALACRGSRSRRRRSTGCRGYSCSGSITLPMLTPFLLTATLFRVIESIQQFDIIYAMTQGGPGDKLTVFQVEAYLNFFQSTNVGRSAALLMILWAITYVLSNIFIKNWLRCAKSSRGEA
jgi:multiple sugar transport system permease protein